VTPTAYGPDLAFVHHDGYGEPARRAAAALLRALGPRHRSGLVVDLGCGTGVLAREVTGAGYDVLGVDLSADMLDIARSHAPAARFVQGSVVDAEVRPCVGVTAIGECFNYLFDERQALDAMTVVLRRVHDALAPGGLLLFDVAGPGRAGRARVRQAKNEGDGWAVFVVAEEDRAAGTLTRDITLFRRVGDLYRRSDERHVLRLYRAEDVHARLEEVGFRVRVLRRYAGYALGPGLTGFLAAKD
jgi:SAM-dependent methyltransferase